MLFLLNPELKSNRGFMKHILFVPGLVLILLLSLLSYRASATHLRAGEITVERVGCSREYKITVTVYTNPHTDARFGGEGDIIDFGDNSPVAQVPIIQNTIRLDLSPDGTVSTASYSIYHTFPANDTYVISYQEHNRNAGVINMSQSVDTPFYLETMIVIDAYIGCNQGPQLGVPPVDHANRGVIWTHNPSATDPNGDRLTYQLVVPFRDRNTEVTGYRSPADPSFYTNYETGNEAGTGRPTFSINEEDGTLTWDAPGAIGEYNIAFHILEWRKRDGEWRLIGYIRRDMQIVVDDNDNKRPDLLVPMDTCVVAGTTLDAAIFATDPDKDNVKIEAYSEILDLAQAQSPATVTPDPPIYQPSDPRAMLYFLWNTECQHVRQEPYHVVFRVSDKPDRGPSLVTYKTWSIRVVGPAPVWNTVQAEPVRRTATLRWEGYTCANARTMQVWRKVDGTPFKPDNCQTGMPALGYEHIADVSLQTSGAPVTRYTDTNNGAGLAPGAKYCYRLVAVFPDGSESLVSQDFCVGPFRADVPVITHVTVEKTAVADGSIRISWRSPFDANRQAYPPPYTYKVYRATGLTRGNDSTLVATLAGDTTALDINIDTENNPYNYTVTAYSPAAGNAMVGNSAPASSVRLGAEPQVKAIVLQWRADVPWSNQRSQEPKQHLIYRGTDGADTDDMVLIASVDATNGFTYTDSGQNGELTDGQTYCYRVLTRGGYGNPRIQEPLENFSQTICAQPGDTIPPCKPGPPRRSSLDYANCDAYYEKFCEQTSFRNVIYWGRANNGSCGTDIVGYNVYSAAHTGDKLTLLAPVVRDTFYVDSDLPSYARCYAIAAVDRSGNIGELSDPLCVDNCPYYELPNVFTPNNDDYNNTFSAFSTRGFNCGEEGDCIPANLKLRCARFVDEVKFRVYNRWGQEVYAYTGRKQSETHPIYIDWNGKDSQGSDLSSAIYYYIADVTFDVVDPAKEHRVFKGWVHLVR